MKAKPRESCQGRSTKTAATVKLDPFYFENMLFDEDTKNAFRDFDELKEKEKKETFHLIFLSI
jgi:hypothetical protein